MLIYLIANFDILTLNQRFNSKKSLKINQKFSFSSRRQYFAFLRPARQNCTRAEDCGGVDRATGYQVVGSVCAITLLVFEQWSKWFRKSGAFFACLGFFYDLMLKSQNKLINRKIDCPKNSISRFWGPRTKSTHGRGTIRRFSARRATRWWVACGSYWFSFSSNDRNGFGN